MRRFGLCGRVLFEELFAPGQTFLKVLVRSPPFPGGCWSTGGASYICLETISTGEGPVTLDLAMLAEDAGEDAWRFWQEVVGVRRRLDGRGRG